MKNKKIEQQIETIVRQIESNYQSDAEEHYSFLDLRASTISRGKLFLFLCFANLAVGLFTAHIVINPPEVRGYTSSYTAEVFPMEGLKYQRENGYVDILYKTEEISKVLRVSEKDLENL